MTGPCKKLADKEWIYEILAHNETGKVPYHFDFTPAARKKMVAYYGSENIDEVLELPIRWGGVETIKPLYAEPGKFGNTLKDEFGVTWTVSEVDRGAPVIPALSEPNLSNYSFPDPSKEYRFSDLGQWCEENREHFRLIWIGEFWERATFIRGMENILQDLIIHKKFIEELLERLCDFVVRTIEIITTRFEFEALSLSDDYGTQKAMQMSPVSWRNFIKPGLKKIIKAAKKNNKVMMLHSCGNIYEIIPDLIDVGLDILHPIQPEVMDVYRIKEEFGRYLSFQGGLRTQDLLPRAKVDEIKKEIKQLKKKMGKNGGYILEPGITIQGDIPLENLLAMIDEAKL